MYGLELWQLGAAILVTFCAGFVKGAIGFALPMIMLSVFASFMDAETALALLIVPVVATNAAQAFRNGFAAAWQTAVEYRVHLITLLVFIAISAPLVTILPAMVMFLILGVPIVLYSANELLGRSLVIPIHHRKRAEFGLSVIGGLYGGISGIWGPPLIIYLLSTGVEKAKSMRVMGVSFFGGGLMLTLAHLFTGVLDHRTLPLSIFLALPALLGIWVGFRAHDRLDPAKFRRFTLLMLLLTGANLLRKALM
ncbi:hypothetical protein BFP70_15170 [Thioclava sp. SK-1]|uniref:sulfite exporter TauE/SafE family protein n=1 Tax=Thioclava sp. SK-1 TaxID=1889770 RepID=UPI0008249760|nr:sulfite exporter TauE/SafE family protein [Thioclava sp. SK-1]OCX61647.1 hypothetical protein BFP70_15170 [Thioclava sp. SK-1]